MSDSPLPPEDVVQKLAKAVGEDWRDHVYYDRAEPAIQKQWPTLIWPMIKDCDFTSVVDLATGHGRNAAKLAEHAEQLTLVDINEENIDYCRKRFESDPRFRYLVNSGADLRGIDDDSVTLLYSFDAMVHFDSDVVRAYLGEFRRILKPGGRGFCHHSNHTDEPCGKYPSVKHARNFMSKNLFEHYAFKEGLRVVKAQTITWDVPDLDCLTLFEKPAG